MSQAFRLFWTGWVFNVKNLTMSGFFILNATISPIFLPSRPWPIGPPPWRERRDCPSTFSMRERSIVETFGNRCTDAAMMLKLTRIISASSIQCHAVLPTFGIRTSVSTVAYLTRRP